MVDDNPLNRDMLERRLKRQGFTVHLAASGAEALTLGRKTLLDLVLLDMVMPEMDGFQLLKQLKSDKTLRHIPVIMLSASDEAATAVHCIKMGADDFLPKPCNTTLLMARIESSLAKKRLREMSKAETSYYFDKGTLQSDSPSYVERQADTDLYEGLIGSELCYVLTSRQMGKSSLMVRTAGRLRDRGINVVALDLTAVGLNVTPEQWYDGLLTRIGRQLRLEDELEDFWLRHTRLSPVQRLFSALREVALKQHARPLVVFVDELDTVRSLPFSTDEFFAAYASATIGAAKITNSTGFLFVCWAWLTRRISCAIPARRLSILAGVSNLRILSRRKRSLWRQVWVGSRGLHRCCSNGSCTGLMDTGT